MTDKRTGVDSLGIEDLAIVTNREPIAHTYSDGDIVANQSAGGLVTALSSVADATDATWIAWGSGDADFDTTVVDETDTVRGEWDPSEYTLRRVPLSEQAVDAYYYGYSNQALWPLFHCELEHVNFDRAEWERYDETNERFAAVLEQTATENVWIHDYHLTMLPGYLRRQASEYTLVHFWHIPWPPVEVFEICPQQEEILRSLVENDALGFHVERYRRRFLDCVTALLADADVEDSTGTVRTDETTLQTYVSPVGVDSARIQSELEDADDTSQTTPTPQSRSPIEGIEDEQTLAVGIDRLDYTKGLLERLDALEYALETHDIGTEFVYLQLASKSREQIPSYRQYHRDVLDRIDEINSEYGTDDWQPIVYTDRSFSRQSILATLERADICVVSSRRDGLNLVAEEFVVASAASPGTLLLSEFTGASDVLDPSLTINPFDTETFGEQLVDATAMSPQQQREHIDALRQRIDGASIQEWIRRHAELFGRL